MKNQTVFYCILLLAFTSSLFAQFHIEDSNDNVLMTVENTGDVTINNLSSDGNYIVRANSQGTLSILNNPDLRLFIPARKVLQSISITDGQWRGGELDIPSLYGSSLPNGTTHVLLRIWGDMNNMGVDAGDDFMSFYVWERPASGDYSELFGLLYHTISLDGSPQDMEQQEMTTAVVPLDSQGRIAWYANGGGTNANYTFRFTLEGFYIQL